MDREISEFCTKYLLSPRERDVLSLLTRKIVTFKDIAAKLTLSPSTVSNHFKNIFDKTDTNSKSEVLALFLNYCMEKFESCRYLVKCPEVLVIDDEPDICRAIEQQLLRRDVRVHVLSDTSKVMDYLAANRIDAIISDIRMPGMDGVELLSKVRQVYRYFPAFIFISGYARNHSIDQIMDMGAVALLDKPVDFNQLFRLIMEHFIEDIRDRNRYLRIEERIPATINGEMKLTIGNIGYGGVFIPCPPQGQSLSTQIGEMISFGFSLDQASHKIHATGEVVWHRGARLENLEPGIGVKFVTLSDVDKKRIHDYVRMNRILSFIPSGASVVV